MKKRELNYTRVTEFNGEDEAALWEQVAAHKRKYPWRVTLGVAIFTYYDLPFEHSLVLTEDACEDDDEDDVT